MRRRTTTAILVTAALLSAPALARADAATGGVGPGSAPPAATPAPPFNAAHPTVAGTRARLVNGIAYAPAAAPARRRAAVHPGPPRPSRCRRGRARAARAWLPGRGRLSWFDGACVGACGV